MSLTSSYLLVSTLLNPEPGRNMKRPISLTFSYLLVSTLLNPEPGRNMKKPMFTILL